MSECGCRKGAVVAGCPRHSVLVNRWPAHVGWVVERRQRGLWHRLTIWFARRGDR